METDRKPTAGRQRRRTIDLSVPSTACAVPKGMAAASPFAPAVRVRFQIIGNVRIENVGKSQSCMVSKLPIMWKQTVLQHKYQNTTSGRRRDLRPKPPMAAWMRKVSLVPPSNASIRIQTVPTENLPNMGHKEAPLKNFQPNNTKAVRGGVLLSACAMQHASRQAGATNAALMFKILNV